MSTVGSRSPAVAISPAEAILNALPLAVIVIATDGMIKDANVAAEDFFDMSVALLRRHALRDLVPFGSPLLALIEQVRQRGGAVNEYKVDLGTPRTPPERLVDLHVAPVPERPGEVVVMLQQRNGSQRDHVGRGFVAGLHHDHTVHGDGRAIQPAGRDVVGDEAADQVVAGSVLFALYQLLDVGIHGAEGLRLLLLGRPHVHPNRGVVLEELEVFGRHPEEKRDHQ